MSRARIRTSTVVLAGLFSAKFKGHAAVMARLRQAVVERGGTLAGEVVQRHGVSRSSKPGGARRMAGPMSASLFFGTGKARELAELCAASGADLLIVWGEPTNGQVTNLERRVGCRVVRASMLFDTSGWEPAAPEPRSFDGPAQLRRLLRDRPELGGPVPSREE